jgi:hypothetical protein
MDNLFRLEDARYRHEQVRTLLQDWRLKAMASLLVSPEIEDLVQNWIRDGEHLLGLLEQYRARVGVTYPVLVYVLEQDETNTPLVIAKHVQRQGTEGWVIERCRSIQDMTADKAILSVEWNRLWSQTLFSSSTQAFESWHMYEEQVAALEKKTNENL